ncbi:hypothetical protein [Hugenholtzia roseola]|uniref:hypothetical protein n=1 Tax=Hugenholtzia roseola TaxID=1002 RepID=UPI000478FC26|nr:hypothetical protein [Hugenholtzia roseola]
MLASPFYACLSVVVLGSVKTLHFKISAQILDRIKFDLNPILELNAAFYFNPISEKMLPFPKLTNNF